VRHNGVRSDHGVVAAATGIFFQFGPNVSDVCVHDGNVCGDGVVVRAGVRGIRVWSVRMDGDKGSGDVSIGNDSIVVFRNVFFGRRDASDRVVCVADTKPTVVRTTAVEGGGGGGTLVLGVPEGIFDAMDVAVCDADRVFVHRNIDLSSVGSRKVARIGSRDRVVVVCGDAYDVQRGGNGVQPRLWDNEAVFPNIQLRSARGGAGGEIGV